MNTLLLTLSYLCLGASLFTALGVIDLWLDYYRQKRERRRRPRQYSYDQRVIARIK